MRLWRSSDHADLSGRGGLRFSGRWHSQGVRIVYLSDHPAATLLETLVHLEVGPEDVPDTFQLLAVDIPDNIRFDLIPEDQLASGWRNNRGAHARLGRPMAAGESDGAAARAIGDRALRGELALEPGACGCRKSAHRRNRPCAVRPQTSLMPSILAETYSPPAPASPAPRWRRRASAAPGRRRRRTPIPRGSSR